MTREELWVADKEVVDAVMQFSDKMPTKVVLFMSVVAIGIWLYPEYASKKLRTLLPAAPSTSRSMLGRG